MRCPILFRVENETGEHYVVKIVYVGDGSTWSPHDGRVSTLWENDKHMDGIVLIPDVKEGDESHKFDELVDAMEFINRWWLTHRVTRYI